MEADPPELELSWYLNNSHSGRRLLFSGHTSAGPASGEQAPAESSNRTLVVEGATLSLDGATSAPTSQGGGAAAAATEAGAPIALAKTVARTQAQSQLNYLVESALDYGRLYCVARNSVGEQQRACVYDIQQPGKCSPRPRPPVQWASPTTHCPHPPLISTLQAH